MNKQDIIDFIGPESYAKQCAIARSAAPYALSKHVPVGYDTVIAHEISDLIWYSEERDFDDESKMKLIFDVYHDMPCYAILWEISARYEDQLSRNAQEEMLRQARYLLSQEDDALAMPIAYLLSVDFFGYNDQCRLIWDDLLRDDINDNFLRRLLAISGPVPFDLKEPVYLRLVNNRVWHKGIYYSLLHSPIQIYSQIEKERAKRILEKLDVPAEIEDLNELRTALSTYT